MNKKVIVLFVCLLAILLLYFGYGEYKKYKYESYAKQYKEYIFTAAEISKFVIAKTDEIKTASTILKNKHEKAYYKDKKEAERFGFMVFEYIYDNNWQLDDIKTYSKVILDSCMREAGICLNEMRSYNEYPFDHQSFERAIKLLRPIIRQYKEGAFTKDFYQSSMKELQNIDDCLSETDASFGEISQREQKRVKSMAKQIIHKSYHGKGGMIMELDSRFGGMYYTPVEMRLK